MEGYFKVSTYAKLCGISQDTAWHRVLRGSVESFAGKDGLRWVYYKSEVKPKIPEGYIPLSQYLEKFGISHPTAYHRIKMKQLREPDILNVGHGRVTRWCIRQDYEWPKIIRTPHNKVVKLHNNKPDGYLTMKEWCRKNYMNYNTTRRYVTTGRIECIHTGGHVYIPKDYIYQSPRNKNRGSNEAMRKE